MSSGKVLVIDDDFEMGAMLREALQKHGFEVSTSERGDEGLALAEHEDFDVVLTDLQLKDTDGLVLCEKILGKKPNLPVVVFTGFGSLDTAIGAIRAGAYDFATKPIHLDSIRLILARAVRHKRLQDELSTLKKTVSSSEAPTGMMGDSPPMKKVYSLVSRLGPRENSVLITGESGTGKELVARALHNASDRARGPFIAINCAAMPANLLESELFGHMKGAFTDAKTTRQGLFVQANQGTLFLDEIGEMPSEMQAKLLRALQDRKVRPIGANHEIKFDTRILAATHRDLESDIENGTFREDLFFRINVVNVHLPPLRSRGRDVLQLANHFLQKCPKGKGQEGIQFSQAAVEKLLDYEWPGNVRELQNCVERAVALAAHNEILVDDLPEKVRQYRATHFVLDSGDINELPTMDELEKRYIQRVLGLVQGNKTQAAKVLGLERRTLYRKLERMELQEQEPSGNTPLL